MAMGVDKDGKPIYPNKPLDYGSAVKAEELVAFVSKTIGELGNLVRDMTKGEPAENYDHEFWTAYNFITFSMMRGGILTKPAGKHPIEFKIIAATRGELYADVLRKICEEVEALPER